MTPAEALTTACLVAVAGLLVADRREAAAGRIAAKMAASTGFVAVALALGATNTVYGRWVLGALLLGWVGDALLLSSAPRAFLAGLGAFLLSHLLYVGAFASGALSLPVAAIALAPALAVGVVVLRWLLPHVPAGFKAPVTAYVVVILGMCVAAAGHAGATGRYAVLGGALLFAASDVSVASDQFVRRAYVNRLWGWPAYFVAQLVLAWSVQGGRLFG